MRILHLIYDDMENPWVGGGGATRTFEIYRRIAAQGHTVAVACGSYPGAPRVQRRDGVLYRHVGAGASHILTRLSYMSGAARLIMKGGYDIVIEDVSPYSPVGAPLWSRAPAIASVQNLSGAHARRKYGILGWGPALVEKPLLKRFRYFVAVSPGIAAQLRASVGPRAEISVVPNSTGAQPADALWGDGPAGEGGYILFLGRIDIYQKGLDLLLHAFELAAQRSPGLRLVIAGGGKPGGMRKLREAVSRLEHASSVQLLGEVDRQQAGELLRRALLLAMPSRYEAWPLTAIEAGAAGIPVVGSDVVGVRDAAPPFPRAHGRLVPPGDVQAFAAELCELAANPEVRTSIGARGPEWAGRFTWDALAARQLDFYEKVVGRERLRPVGARRASYSRVYREDGQHTHL